MCVCEREKYIRNLNLIALCHQSIFISIITTFFSVSPSLICLQLHNSTIKSPVEHPGTKIHFLIFFGVQSIAL